MHLVDGQLGYSADRKKLKMHFNSEFTEEGKFAGLLLHQGVNKRIYKWNFRCWSDF